MYRFGGVEVDPRAREVRRAGQPEHLEPQAFDLLVHLIERRDEVVAKHDLLDGVWGHRFVSEAALTTRIKEIRRAVGDAGATQHTIRNVRGRGYRFVAQLDDPAPVPGPASRLVGRAEELAEIVRRIAAAPVVTLVGPGGVGKSTLARAALQALTPDGSGHVVELAPLASEEQVLPALARSLDIAYDPERPQPTLASIARLDGVLLIDNCEHVVDAVGDVVARITASPGARVRVLATSQLRLGVSGEHVIGLAPLGPDEAVALFDARASAAQPAWRLHAIGTERVAALLDQIDRLPLTIEMSAARLATMTFDDLEAAVGETGRLVQLTHRTPTRRHRTLGSLVEWSADLLPEDERRAFVEFSVFAGSVTAADATRVLGDRTGSIDALADRSLLAVDVAGDAARYRMLDTVKGVARRWLTVDPSGDRVHHRHAAVFTDAALEVDRALRSPDELAGRRRLDAIVAEVRQAHGWSRDHSPELADRLSAALHLASYGRLWGEPATWSRSLLEVAGDPVTAPYPGAHLLVAGDAANRSELGAARVHAERVLATTSEPRLAGIAHEILSDIAMYGGRLDDCERHAEQLLSIGDELDDEHMRVVGLVNQSLLRTFGGSPDAGLRHLDGAETDDMPPSSLAWLAYARGEALADLGERDAAVAALEEAIEIAGSVGNPFVVSVGQSSLATEHARHGDRADAYAVYADCFRGYLRHGNLVHSVITLRNLVGLLHADGDLRGAAVIGVATSNDGVRPTHGTESAAITAVMEEIESAVWPDRFAAWVAEARGLDLDGAVRRALAIVEAHRATR